LPGCNAGISPKSAPLAEDVLLVIEVADSTLSRDRNKKGKIYASAGIADYWIVNIRNRCLEIRRDPCDGSYHSIETIHPGQQASPLAFPEVALDVTRLFPD
jgi:Uma2 family endonuclease